MSNLSLLLFIPETGIYPYLRGLAVLGDAVQKNGGQVYISRCTGQMLRCPMMAMYMLSVDATAEDKAKLCKICAKGIIPPQSKYGFKIIDLVDFVDENLYREIDNILNVPEEAWKEIQYNDFPVGKVAEYDFSLESKYVVYPNMSENHRKLYANYIKNTILALELGERICKRHKLSLVVTFNPYAQCQGLCFSANKVGVDWNTLTYPQHFNVDASQFLISKSMSMHLIMLHIGQWNREKDTPILPEYVSECWEDTIFRIYQPGSHIFSNHKSADPDSIFNFLNLNSQLKTLVAYTCSYDEMAGLESIMHIWGEDVGIKHVFFSQIDWLRWLKDYAAKRSDIQIVVRIHPREGGRQFGFGSRHLGQLKEAFPVNTDKFKIIWPDDPFSSYDLMELADLCLVPWSNMGLEAARVGIPVLAYTSNMFYPDDDFIQVATTMEEYERRLATMIVTDYTWQYLVKAIRFYHWRTFVPALDLSDTVPINFNDDTIWPSAPKSSIGVINDILQGKQDLMEYNIKQWHVALSAQAVTCEAEAMRFGIRRFLDKIFYPPVKSEATPNILFRIFRRIWRKLTGKTIAFSQKSDRQFVDYSLEYSEDPSRLTEYKRVTKKDANLRIFVKDGLHIVLVHNGSLKRRMSPMVSRLVVSYIKN